MSDLVVGLDVGTTVVKAAVFRADDLAAPVAVERVSSPTRAPRPGWSETDPQAVTGAVLASLARVVQRVDRRAVRAIGTSGTACGAWLRGRDGRPARPAILWNDGRAADVVGAWHADGRVAELFARTGNVPYPGYTLPLLAWLDAHEPAALAAAGVVLCCKDWVRAELTGVVASDETDASYVPFDIRERSWSRDLLELCGVQAHERLLPRLAEEGETAPLRPDVARDLGLDPSVLVAVGLTDIVAGVVGGGALEPGAAVSNLGTSANSSVLTEAPLFAPEGVGIMAAAPLGQWARTMVNTAGSVTLDWTATLLAGGDVGALLALAGQAPPGANGVVLLPYLSHAGVVSPFVAPDARAAFTGMRVDTTAADLARGAVEGLAFAVADGYASMPVELTELAGVGGVARSDLFLQSLADATGKRVLRPAGEEFGARGVALLAARAANLLDGDGALRAACRDVRLDRAFEPRRGVLDEAYARYAATVEANRPLWRHWA